MKFAAIMTLLGVGIPILLIAMMLNGPGRPIPQTLPTAILIAIVPLEFLFICLGSLLSEKIRNTIFEPSQELEESGLTLLLGAGLSTTLSIVFFHRAWELFQQTRP